MAEKQMTALERYQARKAAAGSGVNPPEAEKVLATETAAEISAATAAPTAVTQPGSSEPAPAAIEPPKRTRRTRAQIEADSAASSIAAAEHDAGSTVAPAAAVSAELSTEQLVDALVARGYEVGLAKRAK